MGSELVDIKIKTSKGLFQLLVLHHVLQSCLSILPILDAGKRLYSFRVQPPPPLLNDPAS